MFYTVKLIGNQTPATNLLRTTTATARPAHGQTLTKARTTVELLAPLIAHTSHNSTHNTRAHPFVTFCSSHNASLAPASHNSASCSLVRLTHDPRTHLRTNRTKPLARSAAAASLAQPPLELRRRLARTHCALRTLVAHTLAPPDSRSHTLQRHSSHNATRIREGHSEGDEKREGQRKRRGEQRERRGEQRERREKKKEDDG